MNWLTVFYHTKRTSFERKFWFQPTPSVSTVQHIISLLILSQDRVKLSEAKQFEKAWSFSLQVKYFFKQPSFRSIPIVPIQLMRITNRRRNWRIWRGGMSGLLWGDTKTQLIVNWKDLKTITCKCHYSFNFIDQLWTEKIIGILTHVSIPS